MTPLGPRSKFLSCFWTSSCSPVRRHLLEMSWLASRDSWWSLWFECPRFVNEDALARLTGMMSWHLDTWQIHWLTDWRTDRLTNINNLFSWSIWSVSQSSHCVPMCRISPLPPFMGRWSRRKPTDQFQWQWRGGKTWSSTKSWNTDTGNRGRSLLYCITGDFLMLQIFVYFVWSLKVQK